jgi:hypothetical protein
MRVLYVEGVAIRRPELCVGIREGACEALIGVLRAGRLSREIRIWVVTGQGQRSKLLARLAGSSAVRGQARKMRLAGFGLVDPTDGSYARNATSPARRTRP